MWSDCGFAGRLDDLLIECPRESSHPHCLERANMMSVSQLANFFR
jgi:hypothetical protein